MTSFKSCSLKIFNYVSTLAVSFLLLASVGFAAEPSRFYALSGHPTSKADYHLATEYAAKSLCDQACYFITQEQYDQAIEKLEGALVLAPNVACVHANLGLVLNRLGQAEEAITHLRTAVRLAPHEPAPLLTLASAYQRIGRLQEACSVYAKFLGCFPRDPEVPVVRGLMTGLKQEMIRFGNVHQSVKTNYAEYAVSDTDIRWDRPERVLKICISDGLTVSGTKPSDVLRIAFQKWQEIGCFSFEYTNIVNEADILCNWVDDPQMLSNPAEGGEARLTYKAGTIRRATLTLLTTRGARAADVREVAAVALHEVGHCLGIVGHSPSPDDVMYFSIHPDVKGSAVLSARDVETLRTLYPATSGTMTDSTARNTAQPQEACHMGCLRN